MAIPEKEPIIPIHSDPIRWLLTSYHFMILLKIQLVNRKQDFQIKQTQDFNHNPDKTASQNTEEADREGHQWDSNGEGKL